MVEYLQITCPSCQHSLRVRKQYAGLQVACSRCGHRFVVNQPVEPREPTAPPQSQSLQVTPEVDREAYEKQIAALTDELEKVRVELQKSKAEQSNTAEQLLRTQSERDHLLDQCGTNTTELEGLRGRVSDLERRMEAAREHHEATSGNLRQEFDAARRDWQAERQSLELRVKQAHDRNSELSEEIRSLESKLAQQTTLADNAADLRPTDELKRQLSQLRAENAELRAVIQGLGISVG